MLPGLELGELLGEGGHGAVFAARDRDGREVAIKLAHRIADERFEREAAALARVGAPAAPALHARGVAADGRPYLVLERLHGQTLAALWAARAGAAWPLARAQALLERVAATLEQVHAAGLVHRDVKPENLFVCADGRVALLDFGLARAVGSATEGGFDARLTRTGDQVGTVATMAPEQCLEARDIDARADVYALGVLLFEWLTGRPPFLGDAQAVLRAHVSARPPRPSTFAALGPAVDALLLRALAKERAARPPSAAALALELRAAMEEDARAVAPAPAEARAAAPAPAPGRERLALLALRTQAPVDELARAVTLAGGEVAAWHGALVVCAFADAGSAARAGTALAALATEPPLVHVAELRRLRSGALAGAPLARPETWLAGATAVASAADEGLGAPVAPVALVGREALVAEVLAATAEPGALLVTVLAAPEHGATRLLEAVASALAAGGAPVLRVEARGERTVGTLLRASLGLGGGEGEGPGEGPAPGEDAGTIRARIAALGLPDADAATIWPAVALELGVLGEDDPRVAALAAAPGALRHALARALAAALAARTPRVVVVCDDAHAADPVVLDALELATMHDAPVVAVIAARAALAEVRPTWGERARRHLRHELAPLGEPGAAALARALLAPAEFVPGAVIDRLVAASGGVPGALVALVRELRARGALLRDPATGACFVAADVAIAPAAAGEADRAARALAQLSPPLAAFAQLCAVRGGELSVTSIDTLRDRLVDEPGFALAHALDAGVALARLARAGLLAGGAGRWAFRDARLADTMATLVPAPARARVHAAVLEDPPDDLAGVARHAAGAGRQELAATSWLALADEDRRRHRYALAEARYAAALAALAAAGAPAADARLRAALAGRGLVRYRLQRHADALADLGAARALAQTAGDHAVAVEFLLDEATVLDWADDYEASAARAASALELAGGDPRFAARLALADGRARWRREDVPGAIAELTRAARLAGHEGDHETRTVAQIVLVAALVVAGEIDRAAACSRELISECERRGDALHLCATLHNTLWLHIQRQDVDAARADARRSLALALELGNPQLERRSVHNLAELLYLSGAAAEAWPLAARGRELQRRFVATPVPHDALLCARVLCALGRHDEVRAELDWVRATFPVGQLTPIARTHVALLELLLAEAGQVPPPPSAWAELVEAARASSLGEDLVEVLVLGAMSAIRRENWPEARRRVEAARAHAGASPLWRARLDELVRDLPDPT